ncbi:hypothetical protein CBOM_06398 [Ceraceosorus bombacis]|uniref:Uncharacterized protein n=1 Tax=Ceraceosorus bombacis TaxID=401625 RepID=A0A0P1BKH2_9BASI|nr:hypothetical protein CBOM_06398 [Ceraceosorus bombacis]
MIVQVPAPNRNASPALPLALPSESLRQRSGTVEGGTMNAARLVLLRRRASQRRSAQAKENFAS